jgi:metal-responsive CopG/Arc/MetJ family transcriptional regulator
MTGFTKVAVTVPTDIYAAIERIRQRLGKSRSAVVAEALETWTHSADASEADRRYIEGYLRTPENVDEIRAVAAQATAHWEPWGAAPPAQAARASRKRASPAKRTSRSRR